MMNVDKRGSPWEKVLKVQISEGLQSPFVQEVVVTAAR